MARAQTAAAVDRLVQSLDVPVRQVSVEIEFLSLQTDAVKDRGISWDWTAMEGGPGHRSFLYTGQLRALESKGKARVLARPHLMAQNGREAQILIGDRIPVLTEHVTDGEVSRTTEYEDAGIKLSFTPRIHEDGSVTAHIRAEVGTPILVPELKAYRITTRRADTDVCMQPGRDLLIGGLISREEMCVVLNNYMQSITGGTAPQDEGFQFPDDSRISSWAKEAVYNATSWAWSPAMRRACSTLETTPSAARPPRCLLSTSRPWKTPAWRKPRIALRPNRANHEKAAPTWGGFSAPSILKKRHKRAFSPLMPAFSVDKPGIR